MLKGFAPYQCAAAKLFRLSLRRVLIPLFTRRKADSSFSPASLEELEESGLATEGTLLRNVACSSGKSTTKSI